MKEKEQKIRYETIRDCFEYLQIGHFRLPNNSDQVYHNSLYVTSQGLKYEVAESFLQCGGINKKQFEKLKKDFDLFLP